MLDIDNNGVLDALTDGLLILRFLFGFTGTTLTGGAVAPNCSVRCDASTIVPYLQMLATPEVGASERSRCRFARSWMTRPVTATRARITW